MHNEDKVNSLHIMLPKTSARAIWDKFSAGINKEFDSEPVCNKKLMKTKTKSNEDEITDFFDKQFPKVDSNHTCVAVISLDSDPKEDNNCYPQVFSKEYKYTELKVIRHINDNLLDNVSS